MTEIFDFWNALWHDAWAPWDGFLLFQARQRPIDRALRGPVIMADEVVFEAGKPAVFGERSVVPAR